MDRFDLCVIGGGPSGYAATMRAIDLGKRVLLVEKDRLGGAGIHNGALSSKTLWELSQNFIRLRDSNKGYRVAPVEYSYTEIIDQMHQAVNEKLDQLRKQLDWIINNQPNQLTFIKGFGSLLSPNEVNVQTGDQNLVFHADYIILATGSRPRYLPEIPIDEKIIVTSDGLSSFNHFPESIVILGAGVIGCEFATIFSNFGRTKVFLIDKADRILPFEDEDIAQAVAANLEANGVHIHKGATLEEMTIENGRVKYRLKYKNGEIKTYYTEKALISVGRTNNIENMGLEKVGLKLNARGSFIVNDGQTNIKNIYAVGDLTADICLVNVGEQEGRHAVEKIFLNKTEPMTYENVSTIMFLHPEVAGVGMNETEATKAGVSYRIATFDYHYINRAIAMRNLRGFFKVLVTDDEQMRILGMRAMGEHASSCIQAVALLIHMKKGVEELAELIHPHPSIVEGVQECMRMLLGKSIIKPKAFENNLRCHRVTNGVCIPIN
jgi:dihydrolipoamide dehydrogenase